MKDKIFRIVKEENKTTTTVGTFKNRGNAERAKRLMDDSAARCRFKGVYYRIVEETPPA